MNTFFVLLVLFQLKHFLADYPLQTEYMLGKFKPGAGFLLPLTAHAAVHAAFTFAICYCFATPLLAAKLAVLDFIVHGAMDRIKAAPGLLGRFKPLTAAFYQDASKKRKRENKYFWWSLGLDQMVHHLTHYAIIYFLVA